MNLEKLNPWNWFRHEEGSRAAEDQVPVRREEYVHQGPAHPVTQWRRDVDRLFDDFVRGFGLPSLLGGSLARDLPGRFVPQVDVASDDRDYVITLEAPGLSESDINLELQDRRLIISGEKREEKEDKDKRFYRIERTYGSFQRVLAVPDDADLDKVNASMHNGVLKIRIPRLPGQRGSNKAIPIERGS